MGIALFLLAGVIYGQNEDNIQRYDTLDLGEVISIGNRNLTLKDAAKLTTLPATVDTVIEVSTPEFKVSPFVGPTSFNVDPIKPARLKIVDPLDKYYRMYVLAGFGLYTSPKAGLYFNSLRSRKWNYGFEADHFSGNGGIKDVPSSAWGNSNVSGWVNHYFKNYALSLNAGYKNNFVHYYGGLQDNDFNLTSEQIKQTLNRYDGNFRIKSFLKDTTDVNFEGGIYYGYLDDNYGTTENRFIIDGNATKVFGKGISFNAGFIYDYNKNESRISYLKNVFRPAFVASPLIQQNSLLVINTAMFFEYGKLKTKLGLDFAMDDGKLFLYPIVDLKYPLLEQSITPYIGINGKVIRNTFSTFFDINPYTISTAEIKNTKQKFHFYGGIKGRISNRWSYDFSYSFESNNDYALFVNDTVYSYENRFNVIYDDIKLNRFFVSINYRNSEKLKMSLTSNFYNYTTNKQLFAWNQPNLKIDFLVNYNLSDKFLVNFDIFYIGNRKAASLNPVEGIGINEGVYVVDLDAYFDVNLRFEYRYNSRLSGFVEFNNLLSSKYDLWYKYQVQPFFGLVGVTFSF